MKNQPIPPPKPPNVNHGWTCPKCGTVNAPWMPTCGGCTKRIDLDLTQQLKDNWRQSKEG